jgi:hypothetical protein
VSDYQLPDERRTHIGDSQFLIPLEAIKAAGRAIRATKTDGDSPLVWETAAALAAVDAALAAMGAKEERRGNPSFGLEPGYRLVTRWVSVHPNQDKEGEHG